MWALAEALDSAVGDYPVATIPLRVPSEASDPVRRGRAAAPHATGVLFPGVALQFPLCPPARTGSPVEKPKSLPEPVPESANAVISFNLHPQSGPVSSASGKK